MGLLGSLGGSAPSVDPSAWIAPGAVVVGRVTVGRDASIWYGTVVRADEDEITIGPECNIQDLCCLHVDEGEPVVLESRASLGHRAVVHGAHVGAGALIGIGAIVLGRARIGAGALIARFEISGKTYPARIVGSDLVANLALLQLSGGPFKPVAVGETDPAMFDVLVHHAGVAEP